MKEPSPENRGKEPLPLLDSYGYVFGWPALLYDSDSDSYYLKDKDGTRRAVVDKKSADGPPIRNEKNEPVGAFIGRFDVDDMDVVRRHMEELS